MLNPDALEGRLDRFPYLKAFVEGDEEARTKAAWSLRTSLERKFPSGTTGRLFFVLELVPDIQLYFSQIGFIDSKDRVNYESNQVMAGFELRQYDLVVPARTRILAQFSREEGVNQVLEARVHDGLLRAGVYLSQAPGGTIDNGDLVRTAFPPQDTRRN